MSEEKYIRFFRDRVIPCYNKEHMQELLKYSKEYGRGIEPTLNVLMAVYLHERGDTFSDNVKVNTNQPDFYLDNSWTLNVKTSCRLMSEDRKDSSKLRAKKPWIFYDIDNKKNNTDAYLLLFLAESLDLVITELKDRGMAWDYPQFVGGYALVMCWKEVRTWQKGILS